MDIITEQPRNSGPKAGDTFHGVWGGYRRSGRFVAPEDVRNSREGFAYARLGGAVCEIPLDYLVPAGPESWGTEV